MPKQARQLGLGKTYKATINKVRSTFLVVHYQKTYQYFIDLINAQMHASDQLTDDDDIVEVNVELVEAEDADPFKLD